ncbi:MAG: tetratricopeptide repeat protein [Pseudolabrys sp.]
MRTAETILHLAVMAACLAAAPAFAFDGSRTDANATPTPPEVASLPPQAQPQSDDTQLRPPADISNVPPAKQHLTAAQAFRSGARWLKKGDPHKAFLSLEYAADNGHPIAQWKLGRMYAAGEGVAQNDLKAFHYFRRIASEHAADNPDTRQSRFVANAFVALGRYYLNGIPHTAIKRDPERAREMFSYAASYFRDPEAQYYLARLYLDGVGAPHDPRTAARWFGLSAHKGLCQAQAMLGAMLFTGDHVPRQAARGLMWLTLAKDSSKDSANQAWISRLYSNAFRQATEDEKAMAALYLKHWLETRRE